MLDDDPGETPFRWRNCHADIGTWRHAQTLELLLTDVILPGLGNLETKIVALGESDDHRELRRPRSRDLHRAQSGQAGACHSRLATGGAGSRH